MNLNTGSATQLVSALATKSSQYTRALLPSKPLARSNTRRRLIVAALVLAGGGAALHQWNDTYTVARSRMAAITRMVHSKVFYTRHAAHAQSLLSSLRGEVLDLCPASGAHLSLAPSDLVYQCAEPNAFHYAGLAESLESHGVPVPTVGIACQQPLSVLRSLPNDCKDNIVSSFALSTIGAHNDSEWREVLSEAHRVLKPGGRLYAIEHTGRNHDDDSRPSLWQSLVVTPVTRALIGDMTFDRPIAHTLLSQQTPTDTAAATDTSSVSWDKVYIECWNGAKDRNTRSGITHVTRTDTNAIDGLTGIFPVIGVVAVKPRHHDLSAYVRHTGTSIDDLFTFGRKRS